MKRSYMIVTAVIVALVICVAAYGAYSALHSSSPTTQTQSQNGTITYTNAEGEQVNITLPVHRIVSLDSAVSELICAVGGGNMIVGRDSYSTYPDYLDNVTVVGSSSYAPNVEEILALKPDLVIADTMIYDSGVLSQLEAAGIPVMIVDVTNTSQIFPLIQTLGVVCDNQTQANALIQWMNSTINLVNERIATLPSNESTTTVYNEFLSDWYACSTSSPTGQLIAEAGGTDIIANTSAYVTVSPEYVIAQNPDVIFQTTGSVYPINLSFYQSTMAGLDNRTGSNELTAFQDGNVYLYDSSMISGIRYPIGLLYIAECLHPSLFAGINVTQMFDQMEQEFLGEVPQGVFMYPNAPVSNSTSTPTSLTVTNPNGDQVTISLPVQRIVCLDQGLTEIICALGDQNLIVGRDSYTTFPPSINNVTVVGSSSYTPNVEAIIAAKPDLVVANTLMYDSGELSQIEGAGIPVLICNPDNLSSVMPFISTLGTILNNQTGADELIQWMNSTINLVSERLATLPANESIPTVYLEGMGSSFWSADTNSSVDGELISEAGGINIVTNSSASSVTVSPEYVLEQNPDIIFSMTYSTSPENATFYQDALSTINSTTGASQLSAVQNGHVYLYDYSLLEGLRYPIALLYFAQCMYPSLFSDINVTAYFNQMEQEFLGVTPQGLYMYP